MATLKLFDAAVRDLLGIEGGFSNHPSDRGGKTRYGITEETARRNGYHGDMREFPLSRAFEIYEREYWDRCKCDDICLFHVPLAMKVFDMAVNMGPGTAAKILQRELNLLNRRGRDYDDIAVDGQIGPATLSALSQFLEKRGDDGYTVIYRGVRNMQGAHYHALARDDESQEDFYFGWNLHRNE